ncbi:hypothetical protein HDA32_005371 [Spinactinospora alkalitolerans]|uniref:Uncharacterized protein n=1 Tax=Spinactinospora alkalitolerans TaxID=687207 RepID=A0A852U2A6_9ACTN|nr:hypothetical protein [Spinactinospora alkalitolerans]NYE50251.1 hypothetical protein [Spinactinospora alkalitolerans]
MTTMQMIHASGVLVVLGLVLLALAVAVLRLVALPLAVVALALDGLADLASLPLLLAGGERR